VPIMVFDVMEKRVVTIHCQQPVSEVEQLLVENEVTGAPMVSHDGRVMGVISMTDITRFHALASGQSAQETMVFEIGTPETVTVASGAPIRDAAKLMVEHHIHRLVVVQGGLPVGIVSTFDIVSRVASGELTDA